MLRFALWLSCAALISCATPPADSSTSSQPPARAPALSTVDGEAERETRIQDSLQRLRPVLDRSTEGLTKLPRDGGHFGARLKGRFAHASVAVVQPDGTLHTECVDNLEAAEHALRKAAIEATP